MKYTKEQNCEGKMKRCNNCKEIIKETVEVGRQYNEEIIKLKKKSKLDYEMLRQEFNNLGEKYRELKAQKAGSKK